ncbi:MAG: hypothetical protein ACI308_06625 [Muribaculaceae bacterium]
MKVIKCPLMSRHWCINLFGVVLSADTSWIKGKVINHEAIHTAQMKELLYVPFYLLYCIEWLVRIVAYRNFDRAYENISFEREAYANEANAHYLQQRRKQAWTKYL